MSVSGAKIREARHGAGMTQAALAFAIGTRERNIIRWENDQHEPRAENIAAIAKATGHAIEFFHNGTADDEEDETAVEAVTLAQALYEIAVAQKMLTNELHELRRDRSAA